jgi:hypothetical protein
MIGKTKLNHFRVLIGQMFHLFKEQLKHILPPKCDCFCWLGLYRLTLMGYQTRKDILQKRLSRKQIFIFKTLTDAFGEHNPI